MQTRICPNCFFAPYDGSKCPQCGYTATDASISEVALPPGTMLDERYLLGRLLGLGGFGITYLALDTVTQTKLAIKEYFPSSLAVREENGVMKFNGKGDDRVYEYGMRAFIREAKSLHTFIGEKNVVQVSHAFYENGTAYFVMEYLNGINLKVLRKSMGGRIPFESALDIAVTLAGALGRIHSEGILHRDISPENIFVTKEGEIKIIDFGATRYYVGDESRSLAIVLKPGFAPPEQYTSKGEQGPWTDVYALAATFYQSVSGQRVPDAPDRLAGSPVRPLHEIVPEAGRRGSDVIDRALMLNFKKRYQSMDEFEKALRNSGGMTRSEGRVSVQERSERRPEPKPESRRNPESSPQGQQRTPAKASANAPQSAPANAPQNASSNAPAGSGDSQIKRFAKKALGMFKVAGSPYISIAGGRGGAEKWAIPSGAEIRIGRQAGPNHIVIADSFISREHCVIRYDQKNGIFFLRDVSTHGTFAETGERYQRGAETALAPGSGFYLIKGKLRMQVGLE